MPDQIKLTEETTAALKQLIIKLQAIECDQVTMDFSGSGDEGQTEPVEFFDGAGDSLNMSDSNLATRTDELFTKVLNEYGYDWYNNEGGFGDIMLDVRRKKILVNMNINEQSSHAHPGVASLK